MRKEYQTPEIEIIEFDAEVQMRNRRIPKIKMDERIGEKI